MDFDQLHTFLEIVRLKSFSKAAQTCFRTQPAISAQIRQMEQELGTQLFERFGSRISLTVAGKTFAEYARQLLDLKREAFDEVRELDRIPKGEVSIAANEATCINVLPQVFSTYAERFPEVQLQVIRLLQHTYDSVGTRQLGGFWDYAIAGPRKAHRSGANPLR